MERTSKIANRPAFLGSQTLGAAPPPLPVAASAPHAPLGDRSTVSQRPLERMLQPGAPRLRQTPVVQAPSLQEAASNNDWLDWATTFG